MSEACNTRTSGTLSVETEKPLGDGTHDHYWRSDIVECLRISAGGNECSYYARAADNTPGRRSDTLSD